MITFTRPIGTKTTKMTGEGWRVSRIKRVGSMQEGIKPKEEK